MKYLIIDATKAVLCCIKLLFKFIDLRVLYLLYIAFNLH